MAHIQQIKAGLGISGVLSNIYSWRKAADENGNGAQIDLLIDRNDQVINVCEMKYSMSEFTIDADYERELRNKKSAFIETTKHARLYILRWSLLTGSVRTRIRELCKVR